MIIQYFELYWNIALISRASKIEVLSRVDETLIWQWQWQQGLKLWKYLPSLKCGVVCYIFSSSIVGPADAPMWRQEINLWALAHAQSRRAQPRDSSAALLFKPSSGSGVDSVHSRAAKGAGGLPWQLVNFPVIDLGKGLQEWGSTSGLSKRNLLFQNPGQPWSLLCGEVSTGISLHIVTSCDRSKRENQL